MVSLSLPQPEIRLQFPTGEIGPTAWTVSHSNLGGNFREILQHGTQLRLFHEEAGYLSGKRHGDAIVAKFYPLGGNDTVSNYSTIWEIVFPDGKKVRISVLF